MRVLVVLSEPDLSKTLRERCSALIAEGREVAVCHVVGKQAGLEGLLEAQRKITTALRRALEASAEAIPVFVLTGEDGDGVDDCARAWGATDVQT
jgi:hypothetical protein